MLENNDNEFYDVNTLKLAGNVVRVTKPYATKSGKMFAFMTVGNHQGGHTTFAEVQAWGKEAQALSNFEKGDKVIMRAHLANGYTTTKHGDKVQTLVPTVNSIKQITFKKSARKASQKTSQKSKAIAK